MQMSVYEKYVVAGIMSGTSVDGLDVCVCEFVEIGEQWEFKILDAMTFKYSQVMQNLLLNSVNLQAVEIVKLDYEFSSFVADCINKLLDNNRYKPDIIASHGHTVFHDPSKGYTCQIGNGELIAKKTGITTVFDFRRGDVALGGQGAPLVPIVDKILFGKYSACLNLGGFSNISYDNKDGIRIAFDISPLNIVLNSYARRLGFQYDIDGEISRSGKLIIELFEELENIPFYLESHPKSLSIEWVEVNFNTILKKYDNCDIPDLLNTLTLHMSNVISTELSKHKDVLITGGGAYNSFLIDLIRKKTSSKVIVPDSNIVDFKEALAFGLLGVLRLRGELNVLSSVTGASRDSCCGLVSVPF